MQPPEECSGTRVSKVFSRCEEAVSMGAGASITCTVVEAVASSSGKSKSHNMIQLQHDVRAGVRRKLARWRPHRKIPPARCSMRYCPHPVGGYWT